MTSQISQMMPNHIKDTLSGIDAYIQGAVHFGDLGVVAKKEKEIVSLIV